MHQEIMGMLCTAEIDMDDLVAASDIDTFLTNVRWSICSTYHTVLKASPGGAIFGWDMLFGIPFLSDWNKIGDYRQCQTGLNTKHEHQSCMIGITKLVIKYCHGMMVSSANQKVIMNVILVLSHQFIQMGQSGFNTE